MGLDKGVQTLFGMRENVGAKREAADAVSAKLLLKVATRHQIHESTSLPRQHTLSGMYLAYRGIVVLQQPFISILFTRTVILWSGQIDLIIFSSPSSRVNVPLQTHTWQGLLDV